ncbi:peptide cleavage/export ABC transporter [Virgibacillus xinjiangensis]|uniref:Peptide cleavage/export ABC transporter n=1 Tax=Virgibacillus xinjiangensis TaxID=393090 RepID=A0ABV7CSX0_9BACI
MVSMICIRQQDERDCGIACLATVLKTYKTEIPLSRLRELSGTDSNGTSAFGLKKCMEELGFDCTAIKADSSVWKEKDLHFPLIAHVMVNKSYFHYVVIHKVKKDKLIIADPGEGIVKKPIEDFEKEWTGVLLLMIPTEEYAPQKEKVAGITSFLPTIFRKKAMIFNIFLASLLITLFGVLGSYYFQGLIDYFIPNGTKDSLSIISIGLVFVYIFQVIFEYSRSYILLIMGQHMSIDMMLSYFKHVLHLPMNFFATRKVGDIMSRFLDANKIIDALASATLSMILDIGMVIIIGIVLAVQNMTLFLITLCTLPFYIIAILSFVKFYEKANEQEMVASAQLNSSMIESINGVETIKSYHAEERIYNKVDEKFVKLLKKTFVRANLDNLQSSFKHLIELLSTVVILWVGSFLVIDGEISIGQLITYNSLLVFFIKPLKNIINLQVKIQTAQVANKRLNEVFYIEPEVSEHERLKVKDPSILDNEITFNDVTFSYGLKAPVLRDVSFSIPFRSKVALVGVSGSGKSTVAKLLVNYYEPKEGSIAFNNINSKDIDKYYLRDHVTYVPQDSFFFYGSILENLTFGIRDNIDFKRILEVCELVELTEFINSQSLRFQAPIEEGGSNLSGGQKQRIALARALLKNAEVLILDEATSNMDTLLEHKIISNLLNLKDKTIIFVAHHLKIAKKCDDILVMDGGRLVESGTHEQLLESKGKYYSLWEI